MRSLRRSPQLGVVVPVYNVESFLPACLDSLLEQSYRNLDVVMGLENRIVYHSVDVIRGKCSVQKALIKDRRVENLYLLPASQSDDKDCVTPDQMRALKSMVIPLGRSGTPEEAAGGVFFLCSPWSNFVHGQVLNVTGGQFTGMTT